MDTVLSNQALILQEIQSLKLYINEALRAQAQDVATRNLVSVKTTYDIVTSGSNPDGSVIANLLTSALPATATLGSYGFDAYIPYSCGVAMCLALLKLENWRDGSEAVSKAKFKALYDKWLSAANPDSITATITALQEKCDQRQSTLDRAPRQTIISDKTVERDGQRRCEEIIYLNISGNFANGFSGSSSSEDANCHVATVPSRCSGAKLRCPTMPASQPMALGYRTEAVDTLNEAYKADLARPAAARPTASSGYTQVDAMNQERDGILADLDRLAYFRAIQSQLVKLSAALG